MGKKAKQTKQKESYYAPKQTKQTKEILGITAIEDKHLAWRFNKSDHGGPFSCDKMSATDRKDVWNRMSQFEQMTAGDLKNADSNHGVAPQRMSKEARDRLRELQLDDQEKFWAFHINNKRRFWCIKYENIYALLWWDPEHKVYLTPKKNT